MKKALTILLLIMLVGEAFIYFQANTHEVSFTVQADEKAGEDKHEKEYIIHVCTGTAERSVSSRYMYYIYHLHLAPVLDDHTPPPDASISI